MQGDTAITVRSYIVSEQLHLQFTYYILLNFNFIILFKIFYKKLI